MLAALTLAWEFVQSLRWYCFAMLACFLFGGCVGCEVERHRPHWFRMISCGRAELPGSKSGGLMTWRQIEGFAVSVPPGFRDQPATCYASPRLRGTGCPLHLQVADFGLDDRGPSLSISVAYETPEPPLADRETP